MCSNKLFLTQILNSLDLTMDKDNQEQNFSQGSSPASSEFRHQAEWLANLESDFESIIVGG